MIKYFFAIQLFSSIAFGMPSEVLIIRHAEKPSDDNESHLSPEGIRRAEALTQVFGPGNGRFNAPEVIIAQTPRKVSGSLRSLETVAPLAHSLDLPIIDRFQVKAPEEMVEFVKNSPECDGKVVLIAWGSEEIPKVAKLLGGKKFPKYWPMFKYDRVWKIDYTKKKPKSKDLPMLALPGDSDQ